MIIAQHTLETTALPENIWALWVAASGYQEWDESIEWAKLDGGFKAGASGELKLRGGKVAAFTITEVEEDRAFSGLTPLPFARLRFQHSMERTEMGTRLTHRIEVEGLLAWFWAQALRAAFQASLPVAMRKLARMAERPGPSAAA